MHALEHIKAQIARMLIHAEPPNEEYMIARGINAKDIFYEFVTTVKEDDLQRQECQWANPAERLPTQTVVALQPSEPLSELASIKHQPKGFDSRLAAMELMLSRLCDKAQVTTHPLVTAAPDPLP